MFKAETPKFYTSKMDSDKLDYYQNNDVIRLLTEKYPTFQMGYIPDHYDVAFMLIKEDIEDSFQDVWKIAFFKKALAVSGTITLDNIDMLDSSKSTYEIYKTLDGSFENVINISCDLITKHKANIQEIDNGNKTSKADSLI